MIWLVLHSILLLRPCASSRPTPSPPSAFIASPENTTILEGDSTVLRCKTREKIHTCKWYYMEKEQDFFDTRFTPKEVKSFRATNDTDCSIKFSNARVRQTGQWLCKGLMIHTKTYIISNPAILDVIKKDDQLESEARTELNPGKSELDLILPDDSTPPDQADFLVSKTMEGHVINSHLGYEVLLDCQAVVPLKKCAWITPDGIKYNRQGTRPANHNHVEIVGNMKEGNCSLLTTVKYQDEGNWRCIVTAEGELGERVGPLIHLHIVELGPHGNGPGFIDRQTGTSLVTILVSTLFVLLFLVVALCLYIFRQRWSNNRLHTNLMSSKGSTSDYNTYACTWLSTFGIKEQQLLNEQKLRDEEETGSNHYTRYLDMTGSATPGREGYVMFPASSIRSSTSSRTTLSTLPAGRHFSVGNNSGHTSISESLPSMSSADEFPFDKKGLGRTPSTYSTGHLYEEIKYAQKEDLNLLKKELTQDKEGYMIPKPSTQIHIMQKTETQEQRPINAAQAPPYSKIGESGLVPADNSSNWASNPTYGLDSVRKEIEGTPIEEQGSYDVPTGPPVPIRTDSTMNNPLANYDVPSKDPTPIPSGEEDNVSNA